MIERTFIQAQIKNLEVEEYLKSQLEGAGFTGADIQKTPMVTRVILNVVKPGLAIGKKGANIQRLTQEITSRFKIENPQLEIKQIERPELDAKAMVDRLKALMERGFSWRSIAYRITREIMQAGAMGVELKLAGKLGGKGARKARKRMQEGYMKKVGHEAKLVDFGKAMAVTKGGAIGIKLWIVRPGTVFSGRITQADYARLRAASLTGGTVPAAPTETKATTVEPVTVEAKPAEEPVVAVTESKPLNGVVEGKT